MPGRFASTFCNPLSFPQITEQKRRLAAVDCYAVHGGCFFPGMDLSALKIYDIINTEEAGILVFSGIPAFFVTIVLLVQRSPR